MIIVQKIVTLLTIRIPIACMNILTANKAEKRYDNTLSFIKKTFPTFIPKSYMSDYEKGLHNALESAFPDIVARHCYFHYAQAIFRKAKELLGKKKKTNKPFLTFSLYILHQLKLLALLPPETIESVYKIIKMEATTKFGELFSRYFEYYENFWLGKIKPQGFFVFEMLDDRTNNHLESFHRDLNAVLAKHCHPNAFMDALKSQYSENRTTITKIQKGTYSTREAKKTTVESNTEIEKFWKNLNNKMMSEGMSAEVAFERINEFEIIKKLRSRQINNEEYYDDFGDDL